MDKEDEEDEESSLDSQRTFEQSESEEEQKLISRSEIMIKIDNDPNIEDIENLDEILEK